MPESKSPKNVTIKRPSPPKPGQQGPTGLTGTKNPSQGPPRPTLPGDKPRE